MICIHRESNPELGHGKTQCYRYTMNAQQVQQYLYLLTIYHSFSPCDRPAQTTRCELALMCIRYEGEEAYASPENMVADAADDPTNLLTADLAVALAVSW